MNADPDSEPCFKFKPTIDTAISWKKDSLLNLSTPILWADLNMRYVAAALLAAQAGEDINEKVIEKILRWPKGGGATIQDKFNGVKLV